MNDKLLKAMLKLALSDTPDAPETRPIFPIQLSQATGIQENELPTYLYQLRITGMIKFLSIDTNVVTLTKAGVRVAKKL